MLRPCDRTVFEEDCPKCLLPLVVAPSLILLSEALSRCVVRRFHCATILLPAVVIIIIIIVLCHYAGFKTELRVRTDFALNTQRTVTGVGEITPKFLKDTSAFSKKECRPSVFSLNRLSIAFLFRL